MSKAHLPMEVEHPLYTSHFMVSPEQIKFLSSKNFLCKQVSYCLKMIIKTYESETHGIK